MTISNLDDLEKKVKEKKERYKSKEGIVVGHMLRGFSQTRPLVDMLNYELHRPNMYTFCGGFMRYACSPRRNPEPASDIDIYSWDYEAFELLKKVFDWVKRYHLEIKHENDMAITYERPKNKDHVFYYVPTVQIIKPVIDGKVVAMGSTQEIISNFDFTVVRVGASAINISCDNIYMDADFMHDEELKILRLKNIHCPISSTLRCMKYARKGYYLPPFQTLRLFLDWDNRDDDYRRKLMNFLEKAEGEDGLSQEEVDSMEAMMRID